MPRVARSQFCNLILGRVEYLLYLRKCAKEKVNVASDVMADTHGVKPGVERVGIALECLEVIPAKSGIFDDWLRDHNKLGGQHKIPRLYNQRDIIEDILQYNR